MRSRRRRQYRDLALVAWLSGAILGGPAVDAVAIPVEQRVWLRGGLNWGFGTVDEEFYSTQLPSVEAGYDVLLAESFPLLGIALQGMWAPSYSTVPQPNMAAFSIVPHLGFQPNLGAGVELRAALGVGVCFAFLDNSGGTARATQLGAQFQFELGVEVEFVHSLRIVVLATMRSLYFDVHHVSGDTEIGWEGMGGLGGTVGISWTFWDQDAE